MKQSTCLSQHRSIITGQLQRPLIGHVRRCGCLSRSRPRVATASPGLVCNAGPRDRRGIVPGDSGWDPLRVKNDQVVFNKLREIELIHARWAMLGVLALVLSDMAGHPFYPPKDTSTDVVLPIALVGAIILALLETYRLAALWDEQDADARMYPGKKFDVLGVTRQHQQGPPPGLGIYSAWVGGVLGWLAGGWWFQQQDMTEGQLTDMKSKELRNGRLAMISFVGCCLASLLTGKGPFTLLREHLADPIHNTILSYLS